MRLDPALAAVLAGVALAAALPAVALATPAADKLVAELARDTPIAAYGGALAWSRYDSVSGRYRLVVAAPGSAPAEAPVAPARRPFDVSIGPDTRNRPVVLYTRCAKRDGTRDCDIHRYDIGARRERRLGLSSPREDEAWPVQWGARVAFVRRQRSGGRGEIADCDVPFVKIISSKRPARRLDRGSCGFTTGMSIRRDRIIQVTFGSPPGTRFDSQVRSLSVRGGRMRLLARQGSGEESNRFSSPSQSASSVWLTRSGANPLPAFVRIDVRSGRKREVRARTRLTGPLARDERGRFYYVEGDAFDEDCMMAAAVPCRLVRAGVDPFSSRRRALLPTLTIGGPQASPGDPYVLSGRLYRTVVGAGKVVRLDGLSGVQIELLRVVLTPLPGGDQRASFQPTGVLLATGADGRWSHTVADPGQRPWFAAVTRSAQVPTTYAVMAPAAPAPPPAAEPQ